MLLRRHGNSTIPLLVSLFTLLTFAACGGSTDEQGEGGDGQEDADPAATSEKPDYTRQQSQPRIPATDSAAAATALSTGEKTGAGGVCWSADFEGGSLTNIGDLLSVKGWAVGVVSTVPFSHATPACFVAHNPDRSHYYDGYGGREGPGISEEMISAPTASLIIGAGHPAWGNPDWFMSMGHISEEYYHQLCSGSSGCAFIEREVGIDGYEALRAGIRDLDPAGDLLPGPAQPAAGASGRCRSPRHDRVF